MKFFGVMIVSKMLLNFFILQNSSEIDKS